MLVRLATRGAFGTPPASLPPMRPMIACALMPLRLTPPLSATATPAALRAPQAARCLSAAPAPHVADTADVDPVVAKEHAQWLEK